MHKGTQYKTTFKYLLYIYCYLVKKGFYPPLSRVNIISNEVMRDFSITNHHAFTKSMQETGVLIRASTSYSPPWTDDNGEYHDGTPYYYTVDEDAFIKQLQSISAIDNSEADLFKYLCKQSPKLQQYLPIPIHGFHYSFQFRYENLIQEKYPKRRRSNRWEVEYVAQLIDMMQAYMRSSSPTSELDVTEMYEENDFGLLQDDPNRPHPYSARRMKALEDFWKYINDYSYVDWSPFSKTTNRFELTDWEMKYTEGIVRRRFADNYIIHGLYNEKIRLDRKKYPIKVSVKTDIHKTKAGYSFSFSARQWNPDCQLESVKRERLYDLKGIDGHYDLHSAIYTCARLMNLGIFDADWDIKSELLRNNDLLKTDGTPLSRNDIKMLTMRVFFKKSESDAYNKYKRAKTADEQKYNNELMTEYTKATDNGFTPSFAVKNFDEMFPPISFDTFSEICKRCDDLTGGMSKYYYNIFGIESLLEMRVINKITDLGFTVKNVYDCFYFKLSEISEEDVKKLVTESAYEIRNELNELFDKWHGQPIYKKVPLFKIRYSYKDE